MPELPEVETTRRGIAPLVEGRLVSGVVVRQPRLRWPIPTAVRDAFPGQRIAAVRRRAKYLLLDAGAGSVLIHLGMSGSLRVLDAAHPPGLHDHVDFVLDSGAALRLTDPRRFGAVLWQAPGQLHERLAGLGPEPLSAAFNAGYLYTLARGRRLAVKNFLMDQRVVVGVGNIYAAEALFLAGIHPARAAGRISQHRWQRLVAAVQQVLRAAIQSGGTSLRDFFGPDGRPGYFHQQLRVYGRAGQACVQCGAQLRGTRLGQRASVYCPHCQR